MGEVRNGAGHVVDALKACGVTTIFSLSGNQIMPVYDALIGSGIRLIHVRHEAAAVYMAEAYAQVTGTIGVALLTAGPGFANGLSALYSARESQTPVLLLSGDAPLKLAGQGAFQEMDQQTPAGSLGKASFSVGHAREMFDAISTAIKDAQRGTPGPVHVSLHDDVLRDVAARAHLPPRALQPAALAPALISRIKAAKRPLIVGGPQFARVGFEAKFAALAAESGIPMIALESPRGMKAPRIGALAAVLPDADLVVTLSLAPNFMLGLGQAPPFAAQAHFICCSDDAHGLAHAAARLGGACLTAAGIDGAAAFAALAADGLRENATDASWRATVDQAIAWRPARWREIETETVPLHGARVAFEIGRFLEHHPESSLAIDGGEIGQWAQAILDQPVSLINGPSGAIGGCLPYAIAAKAARPDQPSIVLMGDGTAGFHFMEFETSLREKLPIVAIIGNDAKWNAEHQIQVRDYGESRARGCEMTRMRYDAIAAAMGCYGENITALSEIVPAIGRAIASGLPACLNIEIESHAAPVISRS